MKLLSRSRSGLALASLMLLACSDAPAPYATAQPPTSDKASRLPKLRSLEKGPNALRAAGVDAAQRDASGAPVVMRALTHLSAPRGLNAEAAARHHIAELSAPYGVQGLFSLELRYVHRLRSGSSIVGLRQHVGGVAIYGGDLAVHVRADGSLLSVVGRLYDQGQRKRSPRFSLAPQEALGATLRARYGRSLSVRSDAAEDVLSKGAWAKLETAPQPGLAVSDARARRVYFEHEGRLEPAYAVEHTDSDPSSTDSFGFRDIVHATSGALLARHDLTANDAFTYRVFADAVGRPLAGPHEDVHPHPVGSPYTFTPETVHSSLQTVETRKSLPLDSIDPWLPSGALETRGNNADAYVDSAEPDGLNGTDFRASVSAPGHFDYAYDFGAGPMASSTQQMAAITQAFYVVNDLHDYWYDSGFTEATGNAQRDNYGRGGVADDPLLIEVQDAAEGGKRDNANMMTPEDGASPRMQIYLWSARTSARVSLVDADEAPMFAVSASFGVATYDVTAELVEVADGVAPYNDGCTAIQNDLAGKIALVERGNCSFVAKAQAAAARGASGVIIVDTASVLPSSMTGTPPISLAVMMISKADGAALRLKLAAQTVRVRMKGESEAHEREGALDASVVQHEWGHYLHHRLARCTTKQCAAMGEGLGDFIALHSQVREDDAPEGSYAVGTHALSGIDPAYFGIRRAPYSSDHSRNALSFRHIATGVALPTTHPIIALGDNAEVHNAGEVWALMLFDAYAVLLNAHPFAEAKRLMADVLVASLLLTPPDATFVEARDALLDALRDLAPDDMTAVAEAFAARGLGTCAVAPAPDFGSFAGMAESFELSPKLSVVRLELAETASCDDDGVLDAGEKGELRVTVANLGHAPVTSRVKVTAGPLLALEETERSVSLEPRATQVVSFAARVAPGVSRASAVSLHIEAPSASNCAADAAASSLSRTLPLHSDVAQAVSSSTRFAAGIEGFSLSGTRVDQVWFRVPALDSLDQTIVGVDLPAKSDSALVTPLIVVGEAPLAVELQHRFEFETDDDGHWDGLVIEYSSDDGASWHDVSEVSDLVYPGTIQNTVPEAEQVLFGRPALVGKNPSYPESDILRIDFGQALSGQKVRLRFRIGTDAAAGAAGFELSMLAVHGAANTPFAALVDSPGDAACLTPPVSEDAGTPGDGDGDTAPQPVDAGSADSPGDGDEPDEVDEPDEADDPDEADAGAEPVPPTRKRSDGGCSVAHGDPGLESLLPGLALSFLLVRRQRRRRPTLDS